MYKKAIRKLSPLLKNGWKGARCVHSPKMNCAIFIHSTYIKLLWLRNSFVCITQFNLYYALVKLRRRPIDNIFLIFVPYENWLWHFMQNISHNGTLCTECQSLFFLRKIWKYIKVSSAECFTYCVKRLFVNRFQANILRKQENSFQSIFHCFIHVPVLSKSLSKASASLVSGKSMLSSFSVITPSPFAS